MKSWRKIAIVTPLYNHWKINQNMTEIRQILVTNALPYANAALHLGHILEYTQTDVWVRFQRMRGHQCYYVSADDAHGTAIMLKADEKGISPEQHIADMRSIHEACLLYTSPSPRDRSLSRMPSSA